jgi:hypothetical protein
MMYHDIDPGDNKIVQFMVIIHPQGLCAFSFTKTINQDGLKQAIVATPSKPRRLASTATRR